VSEEDLEYGFKKFSSGYLPSFLQFETETKCNTSCIMCPHDKMTRHGKASWKTLIEIMDELIPHASQTCPFLMQEPLLEPRLIPILNNIRYNSPMTKIIIYTNMAAMTEELARKVLATRAVDRLCISFYGPTEEIYSRWQPGLDWETTKENIRRFMRLRGEMKLVKPKVTIHIIGATELILHSPAFHEEWEGIVDELSFVYYDTFCGDVPDLGDPRFRFKDHVEPLERVPCSRLWSGMNILFNGDVTPCCLDYNGSHIMGNINKVHASKIWRGEKFNELRRLHIDRRFDEIRLCKDCTVWKYPTDPNWQLHWEGTPID